MRDPATGLTELKARFVAEYQVDFNATNAYIRAGGSPKTAYSAGPRMLAAVGVRDMLATAERARQDKIIEKVAAATGSADWIVERAAEVVNRALNAVPVFDARGNIVKGEWTCNLGAATPALALLAKRHPEFRDGPTVNVDARHVTLAGLDAAQLERLREVLE